MLAEAQKAAYNLLSRRTLEVIISDHLSDDFKKQIVIFIETMNKVSRSIYENIN